MKDRYNPIKDYALIGDCHTAALIDRTGSIDWFCPGRFDKDALFYRILDSKKGGFLSLSPIGQYKVDRHYIRDTNVLRYRFLGDSGVLNMTYFMPIFKRKTTNRGHDVGNYQQILCLTETENPHHRLSVTFKPTFDFGRASNKLYCKPGTGVVSETRNRTTSLSCTCCDLGKKWSGEKDIFLKDMKIPKGRCWISLTYNEDKDKVQEPLIISLLEKRYLDTIEYWRKWARKCSYNGPYKDMVMRSALTLKLLIYEPTGAIVAAPTTSLPEEIGGVRNWDYRYAWLRDSSLILYSLITIGYEEEAADFFEWLKETHQNNPESMTQLMYRVDGDHNIDESILEDIEGYQKSRPVRIGNGASTQVQLDIYGEILTSAYLYFVTDIGKDEYNRSTRKRFLENDWPLLKTLVEKAEEKWIDPDNGIWEVRGGLRHFLYSKLMCWAALDRGIRFAIENSLDAPIERWKKSRAEIKQSILEKGFDTTIGAFTQAFDSKSLDACALVIPRVGLLPHTDPRFISTLGLIRKKLLEKNLVHRYLNDDGLPGSEAAFATCSFWLVDALALSGNIKEAHEIFKGLLGYSNDLGLLSEEIEPSTHLLLGNFPQGFTHMALIISAVNLLKAEEHGPEDFPETETERAGKIQKLLGQRKMNSNLRND
jgi:GH15 family glucan-1,4-alpha-glucosidase